MSLEMKRYNAVYKVLSSWMYKHATRFSKKHGSYLVLYAPKNQVIIMDTWNGHITQGHCSETLTDNGHADQNKISFHSGSHEHMRPYEAKERLAEAVDIYKTMLTI